MGSEGSEVEEEAAVEEEGGGGEGADHEEPCDDAAGPAGARVEAFGGVDDGGGDGAEEDEEEGYDDWGAAEEEDGWGEEDAEEAEEEEEETALVCFVVRGCGGVRGRRLVHDGSGWGMDRIGWVWGSERLDDETGAEFWFEPCAFGRHDLAGVGDVHELVDGDREEGEGEG